MSACQDRNNAWTEFNRRSKPRLQLASRLICCQNCGRSYKGSNIALMVELLAGPLVGGAVQDKVGSKNWGNLMIALDPAIMGDPAKILQDVQLMLGRVKGARKADGVKEVMLPGERGDRLAGVQFVTDTLPETARGTRQSCALNVFSHTVWCLSLCMHICIARTP